MNKPTERKNVFKVYDKIANWFTANRPYQLIEKPYLEELGRLIPERSSILDLGCGNGKPIMQHLLQSGFDVTGVDASIKMLELAKLNFPQEKFVLQDMRSLALGKKFQAIIAWHSFFHLQIDDQEKMFKVFADHLLPQGILLFTSGTKRGEAWGLNGGENLFHASLDTAEYSELLTKHHFEILSHTIDDPNCGNANVWLVQFKPQ